MHITGEMLQRNTTVLQKVEEGGLKSLMRVFCFPSEQEYPTITKLDTGRKKKIQTKRNHIYFSSYQRNWTLKTVQVQQTYSTVYYT